MDIASMEMGLPGLNVSQTTGPPSGLKAIWQSRSSGPAPVVSGLQKLYQVLQDRSAKRDSDKPWVFWHCYWSRKNGRLIEVPYGDRKKLMKRLCEKAGVRYFRFHPIRHSGASIMDGRNVPLGAIQRILGHDNRKTTEIYLHSIGDLEREAIEVFERAREKPHTKPHTASEK
jgi:integrase